MNTAGRNHLFDQLFDIDAWRRFGRAARKKDLHKLMLRRYLMAREDAVDGELLGAAARCCDAFFNELKHSTSIEVADLDSWGYRWMM